MVARAALARLADEMRAEAVRQVGAAGDKRVAEDAAEEPPSDQAGSSTPPRPCELDFSSTSALSHVPSVCSPPRLFSPSPSLSESVCRSPSEERTPSPRFGCDSPPVLPEAAAGTGGPPPGQDWAMRCEVAERGREEYRARWVASEREREAAERELQAQQRRILELQRQLAARAAGQGLRERGGVG